MDEYYFAELAKLNFNDTSHNIKVIDLDGNETKWIALNVDSIEVLSRYLSFILSKQEENTAKLQ